MTLPQLTSDLAFELTVRISMFSILLASLEYLPQRDQLRDDGLMSWEVNSARQRWYLAPGVEQALSALLRYPNVLMLLVGRAALGGWMAFSPIPSSHQAVPALVLTALGAAFSLRSAYGQDGADQMSWLFSVALSATLLVGTPVARLVFLFFMAAQAVLSYSAAGYAKLVAPKWRDGSYLPAIFRIEAYGHRGIAELLSKQPRLCKAMASGLLTWECGFPLVVVLPLPLTLPFFLGGFVFHAASSFTMGLNCFFWSFVATYPSLYFVLQSRGF